MKFFENAEVKAVSSEDYNYWFSKVDGTFVRWGKTLEDDPTVAPICEILDIEVTTACSGVKNVGSKVDSPCAWCYKANTKNGKNMSFDTFKSIIDKLFIKIDGKKCIFTCQLAFGVDSHATSNPDLFKMMAYCREIGIIPNITVADISDETADKLVKYCGAVSVSRYANKDICYDSVKKLTDRGLKQTNIHVLAASQSKDWIYETFQDVKTDPRLKDLNAIVLLSLKKRGRGVGFDKLTEQEFSEIVNFALDNDIKLGLDSCSCARLFKATEYHKNFEMIQTTGEPCESTLFSQFCDVDGKFHPCSFCNCDGIDGTKIDNFVKDVWMHPNTVAFREKLLKTTERNKFGCRECPIYDI